MTPRRSWSSSMDSKSARKLPSPKPSLPLRWMISKKIGPMTFRVKICSRMPSLRAAVDQDAPLLHARERLAVPVDARFDALVIGVRRVLELDAIGAQRVDRRIDVVREQRNVLDALAVVLADVFLDLALVVLATR